METKRPDTETDDRFPTGPWDGFWVQHDLRGHMSLSLTFRAGRVSGDGSDRVGKFAMSGTYDVTDGRVLLVKSYLQRHSVRYEGWAETQHGIWGLWRIADSTDHGGWQIRPGGSGDSAHRTVHAQTPADSPTPARRT